MNDLPAFDLDESSNAIANIATLNAYVSKAIPRYQRPANKQPLSFHIRQMIGDGPTVHAGGQAIGALISKLAHFGEALLKIDYHAITQNDHVRSFLSDQGIDDINVSKMRDQERLYVELLTAVWAALYFLGTPMPDLWDRVRTWEEEEGGGLPNGICVAKAIGDIVRDARKSARSTATKGCEYPLYIHSFLPMLLFENLIKNGSGSSGASSGTSVLPAPIHALGRYYEFRQLQLYAEEKLPFQYSIPISIVKQEIAKGRSAQTAFDNMMKFLTEVSFLNKPPEPTQRILLTSPSSPPACFLNDDIGLLTFEGVDQRDGSKDIPLPAGYMRTTRLKLYHDRVKDIALSARLGEAEFDLLRVKRQEAFERIMQEAT